jgi:fibronectin-binding autotransporter adhesin
MKSSVVTRLLTSLSLIVSLNFMPTVPQASADWIGATAGGGYVDGGDKDYLYTGNWAGGTINDGFTEAVSWLTVYLDGDRTGAPYKNGGGQLTIETSDATPRTLFLSGNILNESGKLYLGGSTGTKLIVDLNGADRTIEYRNQQYAYIYAQITGNGRLVLSPTRGDGIHLYNPNNNWTGGLTVGGAVATVYCQAANVIPSGLGKGSVYIADVETYSELHLNGFSQTVNDLSSGANNTRPKYISTTAAATLTVLSYNDTTFAGVIRNTVSLTKAGSATLTLTCDSTYSGATTITSGTLLVNGNNSAANGAVTVRSGGVLGGSGTVGGAVTVQAGGALAPGNNGVGTLTVDDNLVLTTNAVYNWQCRNGTGDLVRVNGTLTLPNVATVIVSLISGDMPKTGTIFTADALVGAKSLSSWTLPGEGSLIAKIIGNSIVLARPTGTVVTLR